MYLMVVSCNTDVIESIDIWTDLVLDQISERFMADAMVIMAIIQLFLDNLSHMSISNYKCLISLSYR